MSDTIDPFSNLDIIPEKKEKNINNEDNKKNNKINKQIVDKISNKKNIDDPKIKQKLIMSIQKYGNNSRFGEYLTNQGHDFKISYLKKLNIEDLKLELAKQELALSNRTSSNMIDNAIKSGIIFSEKTITSTTKYKIHGLTDELYSNDEYLDLLERSKLAHFNISIKLDPLLELAFVIAQTAVILHGKNTFHQNLKTKINLDDVISDNIVFE